MPPPLPPAAVYPAARTAVIGRFSSPATGLPDRVPGGTPARDASPPPRIDAVPGGRPPPPIPVPGGGPAGAAEKLLYPSYRSSSGTVGCA